ncbi:putative glycoside hydrolase [Peterkaempfera griseoplana]|uniref:putative glycoside hydrolase n=1 Tax=Peterkaempfera griseoplana TaxID=66896 RepID=UPI0007C84C80|nr:putative glycoside hydrolase [Peterkaempfera griseoplana]
MSPASASRSGASRSRKRPLLRSRKARLALAAGVVVVACGAAGAFTVQALTPELTVRGLGRDSVLNAAHAKSLAMSVTADDTSLLRTLKVTLDGRTVPTRLVGDRLQIQPPPLAEGRHRLSVEGRGGSIPFTSPRTSRTFTVDTTAPTLRLAPALAPTLHSPVTIHGTAKGASKVEVDGRQVDLGSDGAFSVTVPNPPPRVQVTARDRAGNSVTDDVQAVVHHPLMRAAHLTAIGWTSDSLREGVLNLVRQKKLNAVELDIKDEDGEIGYASQVPLARKIGSAKGYYDARKAIAEIHKLGAQVVGRIVAFRDPILANAAWGSGHRNSVVQTPGGEPYGGGNYGSLAFTNFADPIVRKYNMDLASEAASLGFDDILYDYVRRPDGPLSSMAFPGLGTTTPEQSIADFVAETRAVVRPKGAFLGVSVFGVAATRPREIAQDIGLMAQQADYIAPMVYPSHWGAGEYKVPDPNSAPYAIVQRSLADFARKTKGSEAQVIPWLQDFSLGVHYGPAEVQAQIRAAADDGMHSFLLWNAGAKYQGDALAVIH